MTETPDPLVVDLLYIDQRIEDWRAIPQTPEQAAPEQAVRRAEERLTTPCPEIPLSPLITSTEENLAEADRELDQSCEYEPEVPRGDKNSTQLLVWRVQIGDKVAHLGERQEVASLYFAAATKAEAIAMATRVIRHPETPYPASWKAHIARELVDVLVTEPLETKAEGPGDLGPL